LIAEVADRIGAMRVLAITMLAALLVAPTAGAVWSRGGLGGGGARAKTLGTGAVPTGAASGKKVTVAWTASTFVEGGNAPGYVVRRYNAATGVLQSIGAACSGTLTGLSCTESNVPSGTWQYTVTPAAAVWRGREGGKGAAVTVA
jgi:hypothetical protein